MTKLIADIGQSHGGKIDLAFSAIETLAKIGVDYAKFQIHYPEDQPSRADHWEETGFTDEEWDRIAYHCKSCGIGFTASPFSIGAALLMSWLGVKVWKVASGQVTNIPMLEEIASLNPETVIISNGLGTNEEINKAHMVFISKKLYPTNMVCTSIYPTPPEDCQSASNTSISDHSGTPWPSIVACARYAPYVEFHVGGGKDKDASVSYQDVAQIVAARDFIAKMGTNAYKASQEMRDKYLWPVS